MDTDFEERFSGSSSDDEADDSWKEQPGDVDMESFSPCFFCDETFCDVNALLLHCLELHGFNLPSFASELHLDCFGFIKLVNYIRKEKPTIEQLNAVFTEHTSAIYSYPWNTDEFLQPSDDKDLLLQYDYEGKLASVNVTDSSFRNVSAETQQRLQQQEIIIAELQEVVSRLRSHATQNMFGGASSALASQNFSEQQESQTMDESYFESYDHFAIHEEMLKDKVRTEAYLQAIKLNSKLFSGKHVLDVGCGTGILSLFAARFGSARQVTAVDFSDIAFSAMDIVRENKLDSVITVLHKRVEDVVLEEKCDIIISEWMGYFLLFESMLETVLYARDHLLKPDGKVLPDIYRLYICGSSCQKVMTEHIEFWNDVYGFQMSCMKSKVIKEASVTCDEPDSIITNAALLKEYDLNDKKLNSQNALSFVSEFSLQCKEGCIRALVAYYDAGFVGGCENKVEFSTAPDKPQTHWKQTVFILQKPIHSSKGQVVNGKLSVRKAVKDPRCLCIDIAIDGQKLSYMLA